MGNAHQSLKEDVVLGCLWRADLKIFEGNGEQGIGEMCMSGEPSLLAGTKDRPNRVRVSRARDILQEISERR